MRQYGAPPPKRLQESEPFDNNHDKVLHICDDRGRRQASAVQQFVYDELVRIDRVEEDGADGAVRQMTVVAFFTIPRIAVCPS